jgi:replicative DNA helicase
MTQPPHAPEAEQELVSAAFVDATCLERIEELVSPEDIWDCNHRAVYVAQLAVYKRTGLVDLPLLIAELESRGMSRPYGSTICAAAMDRAGSTANVEHCARVVRDRSTLRRMIDVNEALAAEARRLPDDVEAFACQAETRVRAVSEKASPWGLKGADQAAAETMERIHRAKAGDASVLGLQTGYRELDDLTGGLQDGITWVMARPARGKSSLLLDIVLHVAQQGGGVFVWSGEMPEHVVISRLMGKVANFCVKDMVGRAELGTDEMRRIQDACHVVSELPLFIDCQPRLKAEQITLRSQRARRELDRKGSRLRLVVVDHFHKMDHGPPGQRRDDQMRHASNWFSDWGKAERLPLLIGAQVNRGGIDRDPTEGDLRECGAAEEDAEAMIGIHFPWKVANSVAPRGLASVTLPKNRAGGDGRIQMRFDGPCMRFREEV